MPLVFGALSALQGAAQGSGAQDHGGPVVVLVGGVIGLLVVSALVDALSRRLNIPFTVGLVLAGAGLAALGGRWAALEPFTAIRITPDVVFFVFLPTLIFQSAVHLDARDLRANLAPTLTLAVPGLLLSTVIIGTIVRIVAPGLGLAVTWPEAFLLGAILSATDPVAVISIFARLGAPKRLTVLVEGESLFNDATAIVLARIILAVIAAGTFTLGTLAEGTVAFLGVFFGGLLVGTVLALVVGTVMGRVRRDPFLEITATTVLAYLSFYVAEHILHVSGVIAVVAAGVLMGGWGRTKVSASVGRYLESFWNYIASVANALMFLLVGLTVNVAELVSTLPMLAWVLVAMLLSRAVVIYTLVPLAARWPGTDPVSRSYQTVMFWGGLRGAIALAIAYTLPDTLEVKELFVTLTIGAVLFTLVVQGLTIESVVRHFKLDVPPLADRLAALEAMIAAKLNALQALPALQAGGLFTQRVADDARSRAEGELADLRSELAEVRASELDAGLERTLLYLRCFQTERAAYLDMFHRGHLTERAYRDLEHSVVIQTDAVRHYGRLPDYTMHHPTGDRLLASLLRAFEWIPVVGRGAERARQGTAERDYQATWARFHGDGRVLEDLREVSERGSHTDEVVDEVASLYRLWRENARARLDQTAEVFPEFVTATQELLVGRLAVEAERSTIERQAEAGALPAGVARSLTEVLDRAQDALETRPMGRIGADPDELLQNVPFFQGLPPDEFAIVVAHLNVRTAPRGEEIVRQGERGSSIFLVARGVVRVVRREGAEERDVATLKAGDFFGEMALLHGGERTATCRAVTPCALYELERTDLDEVLEACPAMERALQQAAEDRRASLEAGRDDAPGG